MQVVNKVVRSPPKKPEILRVERAGGRIRIMYDVRLLFYDRLDV